MHGQWGNPYRIGEYVQILTPSRDRPGCVHQYGPIITPGLAVLLYQMWIFCRLEETIRAELAGKDLACWCPLDRPCHADVLLKIANARTENPSHS